VYLLVDARNASDSNPGFSHGTSPAAAGKMLSVPHQDRAFFNAGRFARTFRISISAFVSVPENIDPVSIT